MSNQFHKLRQPGKRVFPQPKPKLSLVKPTAEHRPLAPIDGEVTEMLRQMRARLRDTNTSFTNGSDTPDAA